MKEKSTALRRNLSLLSFLLLSSVFALAQVSVSGKITDENNKPLEGVTVQVSDTKASTLTGPDGAFRISVPTSKSKLVFTSVGFERREVAVGTDGIVNVTLQSQNNALQDVVVIGYATVRKKDVTGAVSGIGEKEIKSRPVQDAVQAMQGKVAGVDITSNERPGSIGSINIRGVRSLLASNNPLFVVDGIPLVSGGIDNFNPNDIESIDVLKDASATAIYGSRGANGVVIVTTKQGKNGRVNLNFNSSLRFDNLVDNEEMFSAAEYITFRRWAYYYQGLNYTTGISTNPRGDQPTLATDRVLFNATADPAAWANIAKGWASGKWDGSAVTTTDWRGLVTQQSVTSDNTISVSGGTDKMKAYASFGYLNNTGTIKGQAYKRYTTNINAEMTPTKWFTFGTNVSVAYSIQQYGQSTRNVSTVGTPSGGLYESARSLFPYAVPYDSAGNRVLFPGGDNSWKNVVDEWKYNIDQRTTMRAFGSINAQVDIGNVIHPLKGLKYRINFGPDINMYTDGVYIDANSVANGGSSSYASLLKGKAFSYTLDNLLYYDKTIGAHSFGLTLLASQTAFTGDSSTINGNGVPYSPQLWNALTSGVVTTLSTSSNLVEQQLLSYMGRVNYSFKDRYLLTASIRRDGSSVFAKGHQYDNFPSAALAWRISREEFMHGLTWMDDLKLRAGIGVTGNSAVRPYTTQGAIVSVFYPFSSTNTAGAYLDPLLANQALKWEKTQQVNLGVDFSLFSRRVSGSVDVYSSKTYDLLLNRGLPTVTGYTSTYYNIGKTANKGIDITVSTVNYRSRSLMWSTTINASWQKDHIVALSNGNQDDIVNSLFIGQPLGVIYGYKAVGIWQPGDTTAIKAFNANGGSFSPGFTRVADLNGDNKIDPNNDRQLIGWTRPRWVVGMTNTFVYKGIELSVFLYGRLHYWYNTGGEGEAGRGVTRKIDYYTPDHTNSEYEKPVYNAGNASLDPYFAALGYKKASFIKVRNISLGYTVNNRYLGKAGISNLRAYVQVANPGMLFSQIKYLDMDVVSPTWNRGVTVGINATF